jgi:tRNA modification GTPase
VVIAGQPNAGKSSLLNALAGAELAIVTPIAGTTRDTIGQTIQIEGVPLHVVDTAGLRESDEPVEAMGIARAWRAIDSADVVLFVHDLERRVVDRPTEPADQDISPAPWPHTLSAQCAGPARLEQMRCAVHAAGPADCGCGVTALISAKTGAGLDASAPAAAGMRRVGRRMRARVSAPVSAMSRLWTGWIGIWRKPKPSWHKPPKRWICSLKSCAWPITPWVRSPVRSAADDLLGVIFSSFCIGK